MGKLDDFLTGTGPTDNVNINLYRLYVGDTILRASMAGWNEDELVKHLASMQEYLRYLSEINDLIVQEIADVSDQEYGELKNPFDEDE